MIFHYLVKIIVYSGNPPYGFVYDIENTGSNPMVGVEVTDRLYEGTLEDNFDPNLPMKGAVAEIIDEATGQPVDGIEATIDEADGKVTVKANPSSVGQADRKLVVVAKIPDPKKEDSADPVQLVEYTRVPFTLLAKGNVNDVSDVVIANGENQTLKTVAHRGHLLNTRPMGVFGGVLLPGQKVRFYANFPGDLDPSKSYFTSAEATGNFPKRPKRGSDFANEPDYSEDPSSVLIISPPENPKGNAHIIVDEGQNEIPVTGVVWIDLNKNGKKDKGEGISGLDVALVYSNGIAVSSLTSTDGEVRTDLPVGKYHYEIKTVDGLKLLNPAEGSPNEPTSGSILRSETFEVKNSDIAWNSKYISLQMVPGDTDISKMNRIDTSQELKTTPMAMYIIDAQSNLVDRQGRTAYKKAKNPDGIIIVKDDKENFSRTYQNPDGTLVTVTLDEVTVKPYWTDIVYRHRNGKSYIEEIDKNGKIQTFENDLIPQNDPLLKDKNYIPDKIPGLSIESKEEGTYHIISGIESMVTAFPYLSHNTVDFYTNVVGMTDSNAKYLSQSVYLYPSSSEGAVTVEDGNRIVLTSASAASKGPGTYEEELTVFDRVTFTTEKIKINYTVHEDGTATVNFIEAPEGMEFDVKLYRPDGSDEDVFVNENGKTHDGSGDTTTSIDRLRNRIAPSGNSETSTSTGNINDDSAVNEQEEEKSRGFLASTGIPAGLATTALFALISILGAIVVLRRGKNTK